MLGFDPAGMTPGGGELKNLDLGEDVSAGVSFAGAVMPGLQRLVGVVRVRNVHWNGINASAVCHDVDVDIPVDLTRLP
jgi:hypothetical protein